METHLALVMLMSVILSASATHRTPRNILIAIEEMQNANYFTFVMLIRMQQDRIPVNVTFLMPSDKMLSTISLPENSVAEFLYKHSIPSPLMFDQLKHFPTGSVIPSCESGYMLSVTNNGRRKFYLNNIRIVSPNICASGSSITCHGINGLLMTEPESNNIVSSSKCFLPPSPKVAAAPNSSQSSPPPPATPALLPPAAPAPQSPEALSNQTPIASPPPVESATQFQKSAALNLLQGAELLCVTTSSLILSLIQFQRL